jgi:hypothetical protein
VSSNPYVLTSRPTAGGDLDLTVLRGWAIADAYARSQRQAGADTISVPALGVGATDVPELLAALGVEFDGERLPALDDPAVERAGRELLERLDGAGSIYSAAGGQAWRLRSGKLHEQNESRLDELDGWTKTALAGQRKLLEHVDDPGDSGTELEQSLSKLAAAGWSVDAKKEKGPPTVHYAAGDLPLAAGDDWRSGALAPRFAAALSALIAAVEPSGRDGGLGADELARRLPALAVVGPDAGEALLDLRTVAKALQDAGLAEAAGGEPVATVLAHARLTLRGAAQAANGAAADGDPHTPAALIAEHGGDALRFALLHAAAPTKRFHGGADVVGYAAAFLTRLRALAAVRLDGEPVGDRIDADDGLRRRLAGWCDTAVTRSAENYERLDMHRATRNAVALLTRIEDFDARVAAQRGETAGADRAAVAVALVVLARIAAPLAPAIADELWQRAGRDGRIADAGWPALQREPATA